MRQFFIGRRTSDGCLEVRRRCEKTTIKRDGLSSLFISARNETKEDPVDKRLRFPEFSTCCQNPKRGLNKNLHHHHGPNPQGSLRPSDHNTFRPKLQHFVAQQSRWLVDVQDVLSARSGQSTRGLVGISTRVDSGKNQVARCVTQTIMCQYSVCFPAFSLYNTSTIHALQHRSRHCVFPRSVSRLVRRRFFIHGRAGL